MHQHETPPHAAAPQATKLYFQLTIMILHSQQSSICTLTLEAEHSAFEDTK